MSKVSAVCFLNYITLLDPWSISIHVVWYVMKVKTSLVPDAWWWQSIAALEQMCNAPHALSPTPRLNLLGRQNLLGWDVSDWLPGWLTGPPRQQLMALANWPKEVIASVGDFRKFDKEPQILSCYCRLPGCRFSLHIQASRHLAVGLCRVLLSPKERLLSVSSDKKVCVLKSWPRKSLASKCVRNQEKEFPMTTVRLLLAPLCLGYFSAIIIKLIFA